MQEQEQNQDIQNAISIFSLDKPAPIKDIAERLQRAIKDGDVPPAITYIMIKRLEKLVELFKKDTVSMSIIIEDAEKYIEAAPGKTAELFGAKLNVAAVYTTHDFSMCNHPLLDELYKIQEEVKGKIKEVEDELKLYRKQVDSDYAKSSKFGVTSKAKSIIVEELPTLTWEASGEVAEINPPEKLQKTGVRVGGL